MNAPSVIETAEALCAEDRWDEAITALSDANRLHRDDAIERALADTRHRSWTTLTRSAPGPQAEPIRPGPPVGPRGIPEARLDGLTAGHVRAALLDHGSLLLPQAIDADTVALLKTMIDEALEVADDPDDLTDHGNSLYFPLKLNRVALDTLDEEPQSLRRRFIHQAGGVLLADSPRSMFTMLEIYERLGLHRIVSDFLGDRPVMSANKCTLRRVAPGLLGGWHQDGAFLGDHIRAINIWLALTPCGVDAPGLDIVQGRVDELVETGTRGSFFDWAVGDELVDEIAGDRVIRPSFDAGDILIFDEMNLHRTAVDPGMTVPRHAIEFWCFAASTYPSGHIPLVW